MSYQVLARKWRPSTFAEMVGQTHVLKALINALDQQRLHHAYLFTGTRGVGKTTIARLLAKSLNCEVGVSSTPCGQCSACREIAEGRFVDLIEVDAASRTRVEDTRELLENVQYAPTRGRYKVYLIDEVHMLSTSSFNALLKTLEEPPPHVKFLLATTDPQKLPMTVLSRCLQFNLKNMTRESIVGHLNHILVAESVQYEEPSLWLLAEAANGSMRDALSLTDQAIAYGQGQLRELDVAAMLGTVDLNRVFKLIQALIEKKGDALLKQVADIAEHAPDFKLLMTELLSSLHRIAVCQVAPNAIDNSKGDQQAIRTLAQAAQPEDIHLFYQVGVAANKEMTLAPTEQAGFEMALLRMLAFSPSPAGNVGSLPLLNADPVSSTKAEMATAESSHKSVAETQATESAAPAEVSSVTQAEAPNPSETPTSPPAPSAGDEAAPPWDETAAASPVASAPQPEPEQNPISKMAEDRAAVLPMDVADAEPTEAEPQIEAKAAQAAPDNAAEPETSEAPEPPARAVEQPEVDETRPAANHARQREEPRWPETDREADPLFWWQVSLHKLGLTGMARTIFAHSQYYSYDGGELHLLVSANYRKVMNSTYEARLIESLPALLPDFKTLKVSFGTAEVTPQLWLDQLHHSAWQQAVAELEQDQFVQTLVKDFGGELQRDSVKPTYNPLPTGA